MRYGEKIDKVKTCLHTKYRKKNCTNFCFKSRNISRLTGYSPQLIGNILKDLRKAGVVRIYSPVNPFTWKTTFNDGGGRFN